eukprot:CAMPEP_0119330194 /NCGR_PEP_ID=MMETSP1333-20130426/77703_1 /TAXON_ID=418940 /ORGANISM="Scyphosphaera apsteinii, Strain RCC1455" /LENGTH=450 /DNA_ID=CAMNT_0007339523 /DNA_START=298 /DNA_END=1647 /DNA_ORIENTATION=+
MTCKATTRSFGTCVSLRMASPEGTSDTGQYLLVWATTEGMSSWMRIFCEMATLANLSGRTLVPPLISPQGRLKSQGAFALGQLVPRDGWLEVHQILDVRQLAEVSGFRVSSRWHEFVEVNIRRQLLRNVRVMYCFEPNLTNWRCSVQLHIPQLPPNLRRERLYPLRLSHKVTMDGSGESLDRWTYDTRHESVVVVSYFSRSAVQASTPAGTPVSLSTKLRYGESIWRLAFRIAHAMGLAVSYTKAEAADVRHGVALGSADFTSVAVAPSDEWIRKEVSKFRYTAVQWRYEGTISPIGKCAEQLLRRAPTWGCTHMHPCILVSDVSFDRKRPLHDSHTRGFAGHQAYEEDKALARLLNSRLFIKLDAWLARTSWAPVQVGSTTNAILLTVIDKMLAASASELISCTESCAHTACTECCRGSWIKPERFPSLFVHEIVHLRKLAGRPASHCW